MSRLKVDKKTGYKILNKSVPVIINDLRGKVFYDNSELTNRHHFNLPVGEYEVVSGEFEEMENPVQYTLNELPKPERDYLRFCNPETFKVVFKPNEFKGTIDWNNKVITFDPSVKNYTLPQFFYLYFHELAHALYGTEKYVDRYAENIMLVKGYNPSQTALVPFDVLSEKQIERKIDSYKRNINRHAK